VDGKVASRLEREIEKAVVEVVGRLGLKELPLLPAHLTMKRMAKAAVAVDQEELDRQKNPESQ
jgi:hypothetical protein